MDLLDSIPPEIIVEIFNYLIADSIEDLDALLTAKPNLIRYIHLYNWKNLVYTKFPNTRDLEVYSSIIPGIDCWYRLYRMLYEYHHQPHRFIMRHCNPSILDTLKEDHRSPYHEAIKLFTVYIPQHGVSNMLTAIYRVGFVRYIEILQDMGYDTISKVVDAGYFVDSDMFVGCLIFMYDAVPDIYNGNARDIYHILCDRKIQSLMKYGINNTYRVYHSIMKDIFADSNIYYLEYMCSRLLDHSNVELNTRYYKYRFIFECKYGRLYLIERLRRIILVRNNINIVAFFIDKLRMTVDEIIDIFMTNNNDDVKLFFNLCGHRIYRLDEYRMEMSRRRLLTNNLSCKINRLRRYL